MRTQEEFIAINATPDVVEKYLSDPILLDQWRSPLLRFEPIEGEWLALNSAYRLRLKTLPFDGPIYTVTERGEGRVALNIEGVWRGSELWRWFPDGPRTVLQHRVEFEVPDPALRVVVDTIGIFVGQLDMRVELDRLRQLIEGDLRRQLDDTTPVTRIEIEE
jgi:hypothetical protein